MSPDDPADSLLGWLREQGGRADGIGVGQAGHGRGVFATRALSPGETPLIVPSDAFVRSSIVTATPYGLALVARYGPPAVLAAWMVRARRGLEPEHAAYVATLPTDFAGHPLFFSVAARQALRGTSFFGLLGARRQRLAEEHADIRARVPGFEDLDVTEWVVARTLVTSRSFSCGEGEALVPVADLVNHASAPAATWTCDPAAGFRLRVWRPVPAGAEITHGYGPKSNARLLLGYGFTLADNPHDELELDLGSLGAFRLPAHADAPEAERILAALGGARAGRAALAAICRERLDALPAPEVYDGDDAGVANALRVRESERGVLRYWAG